MTILDQQLAGGIEDSMPRTPWISFLLAYAAMMPIVAGVVWSLVLGHKTGLTVRLTIEWAGTVLCFLAGVRRGLSFRQAGGPTVTQLTTMFWLFVLGASSLLSPWPVMSLLAQITGFATMAVADPAAARRREAPIYFQRLRPVQMLLPIISLATLTVWIIS